MKTDYKHQYKVTAGILEQYQDVIIPGFRAKVAELEKQLKDAVPVVRCRDCKYQENCMKQLVFWGRDLVLEQNTYKYHNLDFCSYGVRKEGEADGR